MISRPHFRSGRARALVLAALLPLISVQGREYRIVAPSGDLRIAYGLRRLELAMQSQGDSLLRVADFVKAGGKVERDQFSPLTLADELDRDCARALKIVRSLRKPREMSPTIECELADIEAWSAYGAFFAEKLRGGTALARARADGDPKEQANAVAALQRVADHWKRLASLGAAFNTLPVPSNSKEPFSWEQLTPAVEQEVETARRALSSTPAEP